MNESCILYLHHQCALMIVISEIISKRIVLARSLPLVEPGNDFQRGPEWPHLRISAQVPGGGNG